MKTVQITMDDELVERVDERAKRLGATRSEFARQALQAVLARYEEAEQEERLKGGYRRIPPTPQEFAIPDKDHDWGRTPGKMGDAPRRDPVVPIRSTRRAQASASSYRDSSSHKHVAMNVPASIPMGARQVVAARSAQAAGGSRLRRADERRDGGRIHRRHEGSGRASHRHRRRVRHGARGSRRRRCRARGAVASRGASDRSQSRLGGESRTRCERCGGRSRGHSPRGCRDVSRDRRERHGADRPGQRRPDTLQRGRPRRLRAGNGDSAAIPRARSRRAFQGVRRTRPGRCCKGRG